MSYTLIDYFNGFQFLKRDKHFSAGVQSTYFAILAEFNLRRFPEQVELSVRDLKALAGLKSVASTHEARNILKNNKLVDFHTKNGTTIYTLGTEHLPNSNSAFTERQPNASRTPAYGNRFYSGYPERDRETKETPPLPPQGVEEGATETATGAEVVHAPEVDSSDVFAEWTAEMPRRLNDRQWCELQTMTENYGLEKVKAAIKKVADTRRYPTFEDVKAVLEGNYTKSQTPKGGEKSERNGRFDGKIDYGEEPDYSWIKRPK